MHGVVNGQWPLPPERGEARRCCKMSRYCTCRVDRSRVAVMRALERINMLIFMFFLCYITWILPLNHRTESPVRNYSNNLQSGKGEIQKSGTQTSETVLRTENNNSSTANVEEVHVFTSQHPLDLGNVLTPEQQHYDSEIESRREFKNKRFSQEREDMDECGQWMECKNQSLSKYLLSLRELPACPCLYPTELKHSNALWDRLKQRYFPWEYVSETRERIDLYKPGAKYCIRSLLVPGMATLASQYCCYDNYLQLITRGKAAGSPELVSPQISWELHKKIDILPWIICKGDWSRFQHVIQPNNVLKCKENPNDKEFTKQLTALGRY